jgi:hypothetical protein
MPLDRFVREGQLIEVRVAWLEVTVWFVPEERDALPARTTATVRSLPLAKCSIDGDIVDVRPRPAGAEVPQLLRTPTRAGRDLVHPS